jgi:mannose-6-phosphate isomerase-like protein (cupin superfamily)
MEATAFTGHHRPWCWVESLAICNWFKVRGIVVRPGVAGSRQAHHHPSEHWIVGAGTARVTIDDDVWLVTENNRSMLLGAAYRIKYRGKVPTVLIVVQTGSYLGVDETIS